MTNLRLSSPFWSADRETLYATEQSGARRRVRLDGRELVLIRRVGKAETKARKRRQQRARRTS